MATIDVGVLQSRAGLVSDARYGDAVDLLCARAVRRVFAAMFIVDLLADDDAAVHDEVSELLHQIANAHRRGVDVRIIIGGSEKNARIQDTAEAARHHCKRLGIPAAVASLGAGRSSHKKVVIIDDHVLLGSHNWSPGALSDQSQDSVLIEDPRLASYLADELGREWRSLHNGVRNV